MHPSLIAVTCLGAFVLGYIAGRLDRLSRLVSGGNAQIHTETPTHSFVSEVVREQKLQQQTRMRKIQIDDTKFVTDISTDEIQSLSDKPLGTISQTEDDISSAANRLAQLKKSKG